MMTRAQLDDHWDQLIDAVKGRWPAVGGEELAQARGSAGHFLGLIQERTGEDRQAIERFLESTLSPVRSRLAQTTELVDHRPFQATLVAFGAGFIAGVLVQRVSRL